MRVKATLPAKISCIDYHQFEDAKHHLSQVIPKIKVKEIGFDGMYLGIAYVGALTDPENALMVKEIKEECGEE